MNQKALDIDGGGSHLGGVVRWVGVFAGPLVFALILALVPTSVDGLKVEQRGVLALAAWMAVWWLTEAVPLSATALLPLVGLPLLGVTTLKQAAAPFADELIYVFLGGFIVGLALEATGLHRRLALLAMLALGTTPKRLIGAVMLATGIISMFVSNTATTMMMLPLGLSMVKLAEDQQADERVGGGGGAWDTKCVRNFGVAMLLGIAYAATIGGMGTPIGTPPNLVMVGYARENLGIEVSFRQWMIVAMPVVLILLPAAWGLLVLLHPIRAQGIAGGRGFVRSELASLGPVRREEWMVLGVFALAVTGWVFRGQISTMTGRIVSDAMVAIIAALLLLCVPIRSGGKGSERGPKMVLTWAQAEKLPWGVLLFFGGGLSMAAAITSTGLDVTLAGHLKALGGMNIVLILLIVCGAMTLVGELASNVALATMMMPILAGAAKAMGVPAVELLMAAALASSLGFALPVATPPNAIVFATGRIGMHRMLRAGALLDVVGVLVLVVVLGFFGRVLMEWAGLR
ncbi:MAG: DASS family sodium-coupled anion symporter [Phycisphaerales bacterium]|nr:DASS family sodium-coupled anion symporter [Phycisphaerales bacterium]